MIEGVMVVCLEIFEPHYLFITELIKNAILEGLMEDCNMACSDK